MWESVGSPYLLSNEGELINLRKAGEVGAKLQGLKALAITQYAE